MNTNPGHVSLARKVFGVFLGAVVLVVGLYLLLKLGPLPVAVNDSAFPYEKQIVKVPLRARVEREIKNSPIEPNEEAFESGAHIYRERCSVCHGTPGHDSDIAKYMYPPPPQLWKKHGSHGAVGLSDEEVGFAYWFVANGVRLTGMPSFSNILTDQEMWQVSLLLKNAKTDLSVPVAQILNAP